MTKIFSVKYTKKASGALGKTNTFNSKLILSWTDKNLKDCATPRTFRKGLSEIHSSEWQYRVGDYRFITEINEIMKC